MIFVFLFLTYFTLFNRFCMCDMLSLFSHVRLFVTLWIVAHQAPLSTGFFQARILEWVAISFSRESSPPRDRNCISCIAGRSVTTEPLGKPMCSYTFVQTYRMNNTHSEP